jgi:hypothetical protein
MNRLMNICSLLFSLDVFTVWGKSILLVIVCTFKFKMCKLGFDKYMLSFLKHTVLALLIIHKNVGVYIFDLILFFFEFMGL